MNDCAGCSEAFYRLLWLLVPPIFPSDHSCYILQRRELVLRAIRCLFQFEIPGKHCLISLLKANVCPSQTNSHRVLLCVYDAGICAWLLCRLVPMRRAMNFTAKHCLGARPNKVCRIFATALQVRCRFPHNHMHNFVCMPAVDWQAYLSSA